MRSAKRGFALADLIAAMFVLYALMAVAGSSMNMFSAYMAAGGARNKIRDLSSAAAEIAALRDLKAADISEHFDVSALKATGLCPFGPSGFEIIHDIPAALPIVQRVWAIPMRR